MTNQQLIDKLNKYPKDKKIVFFCNQDVFLGQEFVWNECFIEDIKECLYIEYDDKIFNSIENFKEYLEYHTDWDHELIDKIIEAEPKNEVIRIDLNIA
jgi:hypothetical protein